MNFADFEPLNAAEKKLLKCSVSGEYTFIKLTRPVQAITNGENVNTVRASFIRWLALGGDDIHPLHAHGVILVGAWIEDELDFQGTSLKTNLSLIYCHIVQAPNMNGMELNGSLNLQGSFLANGLKADRAKFNGALFLRGDQFHQFESEGSLRLLGVSIGDNFECNGAHLNPQAGQSAIDASSAKIAGNLLLSIHGQIRFETTGEVRILGASIGGALDCTGALLKTHASKYALSADRTQIRGSVFLCSDAKHRFECTGEMRFQGASIGGALNCTGALFMPQLGNVVLRADSAQIKGGLFICDDENHRFECTGTVRLIGASVQGGLELLPNLHHPTAAKQSVTLDVSNCTVGYLRSEMAAWGDDLVLDGFVYGSLRGANWQTSDYLTWLKKQHAAQYGTKGQSHLFAPQPWQQLISVLRNMGHSDTANEIAIAFEQHRYALGKVSYPARLPHKIFGWVACYGYKPMRLVGWMLSVWLSFAALYWVAAYQGVFAPSDPLVFQNAEYETCRTINTNGIYDRNVINNTIEVSRNWYTCAALKGEYTTFSPLAYSLDAILPLVDLGQEKTWGVYIETPKANAIGEFFQFPLNHWIRLLVWFEILFGWMASLILVAVLTGLTDRTKPK